MFHLTVERTICIAHRAGGGLNGHNWTVRVTLSSPTLDTDGRLGRPDEVRDQLWEVVEPFDHRVLDDLLPFRAGTPATGPVFAGLVGEAMQKRFSTLTRVDVDDDAGTVCSWTP